MELTEEDLKNMSPEELAELQKKNCIFCHIISGRVASKKVYEDDVCIATLDINPANPGHILLIPKEHFMIMPQVPDDVIQHLFMVSKGLSAACLKALKAQGTNIFIANGMAAGQRAQHFMIHIIPRKENDGLKQYTLPETNADQEAVYPTLKTKINQVFGVTGETPPPIPIKKEERPVAKEEPKESEKPEQKPEESPKKELEKEEPQPQPEKKKEEGVDLDSIADILTK